MDMGETNGTAARIDNDVPVTISADADARVRQLIARYPHRKSAIMPALYVVQDELGWLPKAAFAWVAERVGVTAAHVESVATFYTMYYKRPVGKYHVQVCRTLSCMLCGAREVTAYLKNRLQIGSHEITPDGFWSYEEVECLGSCGTAPMVQINDVFFENLTEEKLTRIMDTIEREKPDLRYSTLRGDLGKGMREHPRSEVWKRS